MRKRLSLILSCLFLGIGIAMAQHTVNGVVISSEDNEPIIGATVKIKGTNTGVVTNIDGEFSISSPTANPQLEITYVGMTKVTVKGTQNMKVTMYPEASRELSEVVVTGIQKMDKRLFTGATTKVDAEKAKLDHLRYRPENPRAWCHLHLRQLLAAVGGRRCDYGGRRVGVGRRPFLG